MGWTLHIDAPANDRMKQSTVAVVGEDGKTLLTDRADLTSIQERQKLVKRLAPRLRKRKLSARDLEEKLEGSWAEFLDGKRRQEAGPGLGDGKYTVFDRLQDVLATEGAEGLYSQEDLLKELAGLAVDNPVGFAAVRAMLRKRKASVRDLDAALRPLKQEIWAERPTDSLAGDSHGYFIEDGALWRMKRTADGAVTYPLRNFAARIVEETVRDDGAEQVRYLTLEGQMSEVEL